MKVTRSRSELPQPSSNGAVVSIGVFDGVHRGHQAILAANVARARELGARATVVTFSGHPKQVLLGHAPRTLTSLEHRLELFARAGIEHTLTLAFDEELRQTSARAFLDEVLIEGLGARSFVLGFDSKFGADRQGTPEWLSAQGYDVQVVSKVVTRNRAVSSTAIREAVELGDLLGARDMLGRRTSVLGLVVRGAQIGRKLGFPTANLDLQHELHPPVGVYACRAHLLREGSAHEVELSRGAVCNVGYRPTMDGSPPPLPLVEAHLFDFDDEIYGRQLEVEFYELLRGEQRFEDLDALKAQIAADASSARAVLARAPAETGPS